MVGVKVAAGSREEQEGSLMLKVTRLVSERGMQPGYLLTGRVQSGLQSGSITARGVCGGSLPTVPGGAPSSSCATSGTRIRVRVRIRIRVRVGTIGLGLGYQPWCCCAGGRGAVPVLVRSGCRP
eukprot:scaffold6879_cov42-Phaeocystis_antarctica.AAC.1